jgi:hypothetical protein
MIEHTFIHLPSIGARTEMNLWRQGVLTWDDLETFLQQRQVSPRRQRLAEQIRASRRYRRQPAYFHHRLPPAERWRLYRDFLGRCAFLDIETTGMSGTYHEITVIGLYDGSQVYQFINGENLERFEDAVQAYDLLVTFNGSRFDLPFIERFFRNFRFHHAHIDLRWVLQRLGIPGGLKRIEPLFGISRPGAIQDLGGYEAVLLWNQYLQGEVEALRRLLQYNQADVVNLKTIMELAWDRLHRQLELAAGCTLPGATQKGQGKQSAEC